MGQLADQEPVALNGGAAAIAAALTPILLIVGVNADSAGRIAGVAGGAVAAALAVWSLIRARGKVTPVVTADAAAAAQARTDGPGAY